jgi:DNA (cytosine-5)-methyltransferase 1
MLTHFSLFTGIGGLDLAAEWAGFTTVGQCEWADYPTKVLEKHWPDVDRWRDVRDVTAKSIQDKGIKEKITALSGGFPCQPHSLAGKRQASTDERDLWPEYKRIIGETKPTWVVAENVPGLLSSEDGRFFRGILRDFAELGFDVGWCSYPAAWVGAVHRRERIFTVAHSSSKRRNSVDKSKQNERVKINQKEPYYPKREAWFDAKSLELLCAGQRSLFIEGGVDIRNDDGLDTGVHRLKCLGNMVMPQQAYPIFQAIAQIQLGGEM